MKESMDTELFEKLIEPFTRKNINADNGLVSYTPKFKIYRAVTDIHNQQLTQRSRPGPKPQDSRKTSRRAEGINFW